jgi:hypothetical protein
MLIELRLKHYALTEFKLINNKLYKWANDKHLAHYVVLKSEAFNVIINEHL